MLAADVLVMDTLGLVEEGVGDEFLGAVSSGMPLDPVWLSAPDCADGDGESDARRAGPMLASRGAGRADWESPSCAEAGKLGVCELFCGLFDADGVPFRSPDSPAS